jgi:tetratricopeptide (TPR) repeat protein
VEAWYNLSDLLDEQGRSEAAIECLRTALRVEPDYADATFNLALLLQRKNGYAEAADTGVAIWTLIANRNGPHGRVDH